MLRVKLRQPQAASKKEKKPSFFYSFNKRLTSVRMPLWEPVI
jgi:hypothetical protein